jgi:UDP-N-acetylglucosamine--N-acetylmuramyl-(pentapeptide) pyrophosphoryl-undecaprenol N-acetylglucosamine transferase
VSAEVFGFIDDMAARYGEADVVLCRAGAITVSELCAAGVPSILVPLVVSTTDHQRDNALFLAGRDAALHLPQNELTASALARLLDGLDRGRLLQMAVSARALGHPDATGAVAGQLEQLAETRTGISASV